MRIDYHKRFRKQYDKSSSKIKDKFDERLKIFIMNPLAEELNNHALHGEYLGYRSINVTGDWRVCDSVTAAKFSAVAYFFGKKLYEKLNVPIGLINASWGGTPIETWTSAKYLRETGKYDSTLDKIISSREEIRKQREWIENHPIIDISRGNLETRWENLEFK